MFMIILNEDRMSDKSTFQQHEEPIIMHPGISKIAPKLRRKPDSLNK